MPSNHPLGLARFLSAALAAMCLACSTGGETSSESDTFVTVDGLVKTDIDLPGTLFLRPDHGIGSYDAFLIPPAIINYKRRSRELPEHMEDEFLATLEQSIVDLASDARIPVVKQPGDCVMLIGLALYNVEFARSDLSETIGQMTLVMEFRDSTSGTPLLRYATQNRIESARPDIRRSQQIREGFDRMMAEMDIGAAMTRAGLGDGQIRPGCQGTLAARGRASLPAVSAE